MDLNFIENKKYIDRAGKVYIFKGRFSLKLAPLLFETEDNRPTWRWEDGRFLTSRAESVDIVAEYAEPVYAWVAIFPNDLEWSSDPSISAACRKKYFYRSKKELIHLLWINDRTDVKILKINLRTGETCLDS